MPTHSPEQQAEPRTRLQSRCEDAAAPAPRRRRWRVFAVLLALVHLIGLLSSLDALMSTRTPQGAVAWVVSLNTIPYAAVPAYWVFGRTRFQGYVVARRDVESELAIAVADKTSELQSHRLLAPERITALALDQDFAADVERMFLADFARARSMSREDVDNQPLWHRIASRAAYLLAPVL